MYILSINYDIIEKIKPEKQEMKITYIGHSGFLVESESCTFLFDYFKTEINNGIFPDFNRSNPLFVFVSHFHSDHYNPEIFNMSTGVKNVHYILSKEIKVKSDINPEFVTFVKANTETILKISNGGLDNSVRINTLKSTDAGVAFIVEYLGKTIYHAGDLNWWRWDGDTKQEINDQKARFTREIEKLSSIAPEIDAAFLPLDPRQEEFFYLGFDYTMKHANISYAFPMHMWNDYSYIGKLKEMDSSITYREKTININKENPYEI